MTDISPADDPDGAAPEIILDEAREMRSKQDRKLQSLLRIATGALVVFLSIGTIAVAASEALAPSTAIVVFIFAGALAVGLVVIEGMVSYRWQEGPDIDDLLDVYRTRQPASTPLRLALTVALSHDYHNNDKTLRHVRAGVAVIAALALVGLLLLLIGLHEVT